jgi:hypothetical protein
MARSSIMPDPDKRQLRKLKRVVKKAGSKHRRRELRKQLAENPEEAAYAEENFGKSSSESLNGLDSDATRRRDEEKE